MCLIFLRVNWGRKLPQFYNNIPLLSLAIFLIINHHKFIIYNFTFTSNFNYVKYPTTNLLFITYEFLRNSWNTAALTYENIIPSSYVTLSQKFTFQKRKVIKKNFKKKYYFIAFFSFFFWYYMFVSIQYSDNENWNLWKIKTSK